MLEKTEGVVKRDMQWRLRDEVDEELERYKLKSRLRKSEMDQEMSAYQAQHDRRRQETLCEIERGEARVSETKQRLAAEEAETRSSGLESRKRREQYSRDSRRDEADCKRRKEELNEKIIRLEVRKVVLDGEIYVAARLSFQTTVLVVVVIQGLDPRPLMSRGRREAIQRTGS